MSILFPDKVEITNITRNVNYRNEIEGTPFSSKAFVEEKSENRRSNDGVTITPITLIILPKNTIIYKGDYLRITKLKGIDLSESVIQGARKKVKEVFRVGTRKESHVEVII